MTDDERMDRARRIREMREGSRPDDEAQDDTTDADAAEPDDTPVDGSDDAAADGAADDEGDGAAAADAGEAEPAAGAVADGPAEDTEPDDSAADDPGADPADDRPTESAADDEPSGSGEDDEPSGSGEDDEPSGTATGSSADEAAEAVANLEINEEAVGGSGGSGDEGDATMHIPGADVGDVDVDVEEMAREAGLESAESEAGDGEGEPGAAEMGIGAAGRAAAAEADTGEQTRVLEFALGDEQYCLDIEYVEEIVKRETVTRVPNTPDCVEGVVDLRGQITTILDPKVLLDIDQAGSKDLIVVFDPEAFDDQGAVGWVVDDVNQVTPITDEEVNDSPVDQDHVNGVVDRDGEFVIWTTPELDLDEVAG
ncbi:chemotaxis protein CheW [Halosimplex halophilum]|uniref:chemotaxis protein CheW n=1 Tax=Halosimplex halophilum TaxID=2559572 RepID=UPI00107F84A6|nr:chemotaxis protein CheW [Halosimplex halophilum]